MNRRDFLKNTSVLASGLLTPEILFAKNYKNKYHFAMPCKPFKYFIRSGKEKGGRILIIGGIHGNEEGGFKASTILLDSQLKKGEIAILPRSNPESIFTDLRAYNGDMNRKFSNISRRDKDYYKIKSIKNFIADFKPDVILSLHDGYGFYAKNSRNWGESIIIDEAIYNKMPLYQQASFVSDFLKKHGFNIPVHNTKTGEKITHHREQRKSLTYYSLQKHNIPVFCIEASKQATLKRKLYIHLLAIEQFFKLYNVEMQPSFFYRGALKFDAKNDNTTKYNIIVKS